MRNRRRLRRELKTPNLFSSLETRRDNAKRITEVGNYATRTIRKWIRSDPFTLAACRELAEDARRYPVDHGIPRAQAETLRQVELTLQLIAWFRRSVREEEPSASYADYLCGSIDTEWGMLAEELFTNAWA